jgi:hypothetical protein
VKEARPGRQPLEPTSVPWVFANERVQNVRIVSHEEHGHVLDLKRLRTSHRLRRALGESRLVSLKHAVRPSLKLDLNREGRRRDLRCLGDCERPAELRRKTWRPLRQNDDHPDRGGKKEARDEEDASIPHALDDAPEIVRRTPSAEGANRLEPCESPGGPTSSAIPQPMAVREGPTQRKTGSSTRK